MESVEFLEKMLRVAKDIQGISNTLEKTAEYYAEHLPKTSLHLATMSNQLIVLCRELLETSNEQHRSVKKKETELYDLLKECNDKLQSFLAQQELNKLKECTEGMLLQ